MKDIEIPFGAHDSELKGFEYTIPEGFEAEIKDGKVVIRPKESDDERIRKDLIAVFNMIKEKEGLGASWSGIKVEKIIAYLEKQKERPKKELVYRMNGLMQEYVKAGEDDVEREHRMKCYQLFWDALEDADLFEQKEQNQLPHTSSGARYYFDEWLKQQPIPKYWDAFLAGIEFNKKEQRPVKADFRSAVKNLMNLYKIKNNFTEEDYDFHAKELLELVKQKSAEGTALQKAFINSKIDYTLEEKCDASDYADVILPTSVIYGENEEEYKLHKIIEAAFIAGQKEQKPADDKTFEEWIDDWWKHNKVNNPDSYDKGDEIQFDERGFKNFCRGIRNMYQQKPTEKPDMLAKLREHLANTPKEQLEKEWKELEPWGKIGPTVEEFLYGKKMPAEWSEFDKGILNDAICATDILGNDESFNNSNPNLAKAFRIAKDWLKDLPERFNLQPKIEWNEEDSDMICEIIDHCIAIPYIGGTLHLSDERKKELKTFVKSLRPQPKPTEDELNKKYWEGYNAAMEQYNKNVSYHQDYPASYCKQK